jgi:hypothetical protein
MIKPIAVTLCLLGAMAVLVLGPPAGAAGIPATDNSLNQQSGTIDFLNLEQGRIVIDDRQYLISDKATINGKHGNLRSALRKGMHIKFTTVPAGQRNAINEIWTTP